MSQLVYSRHLAPSSTLLEELKSIFRATPLAVFLAALQARR
jgi:hypothetical protein